MLWLAMKIGEGRSWRLIERNGRSRRRPSRGSSPPEFKLGWQSLMVVVIRQAPFRASARFDGRTPWYYNSSDLVLPGGLAP